MIVRITSALATAALLFGAAACGSAEHKQGVSLAPGMRYTTISELTTHSDLVVTGSVTKVLGQEQKPDVEMAFTNYEFKIDRVLSDPGQKHKGVTTIIDHEPGGTLPNGKALQVDGGVSLTVGEKATLFLHEYSAGHFYVVGLDGKFKISDNGLATPGDGSLVKFSGTVDQLAAQVPGS
jgi:hypothetical protein